MMDIDFDDFKRFLCMFAIPIISVVLVLDFACFIMWEVPSYSIRANFLGAIFVLFLVYGCNDE